MNFILQKLVCSIGGVFHTHIHLYIAFTRRTNGQSLGAFQKAMLLQNLGNIGWKIISVLQRVKIMSVYANMHEWLNTKSTLQIHNWCV